MASESGDIVDYERYRNATNVYRSNTTTTTTSAVNSSDSEQDDNLSTYQPKNEMPKRNKRKNFKPRCTNVTYPESDALNLTEFSNNNNLKNAAAAAANRRRKTLPPTRKLVDDRFSPMDLSKANDSESGSDLSDDYPNERFHENDIETDDGNENNSSENDSRIPSSFSIHNLSKSHVNEYGNTSGFTQGQVCEMREYAVNTMRELLGIYGLTSEVAESITRQLPIAAFSSGEFLFFLIALFLTAPCKARHTVALNRSVTRKKNPQSS